MMTIRHLVQVLCTAAVCSAVVTAAPARAVHLSKAAAIAATRTIEKDRVDSQAWLKSDPSSYLATVDRRDFGQKRTLTVGRGGDNDLTIDDGAFAPHHLRITVEGDRFHVEAVDAAARFSVGVGKEENREATVGPGPIQIGRFRLGLSHQRYPAVIVFDPQSPRFRLYQGLKYFPVDLSYRYELALTPNPTPERTVIMSTRGNRREAERVGWFEFYVGQTPIKLEAVRLLEPGSSENDIGLFFRDTTTGQETYPLGRYVEAKKLPNGRYLLDFNAAYNPACAFSDHYNCPIPPKANALTVAIRAGEMDSHYHP